LFAANNFAPQTPREARLGACEGTIVTDGEHNSIEEVMIQSKSPKAKLII
jgi:hypothetical protein